MRFAVFQLRWKTAEVLPEAKLQPLPRRSRYLAGIVANAEVGFYPAFSPLPDHLKYQKEVMMIFYNEFTIISLAF